MPQRVTERDKELILFIARNKIASRNHLQKKFFNHAKSFFPLNRRLKFLVKQRLLKKIILQNDRSNLACFSHTDLGYSLIQADFLPDTNKIPERSEKQTHDLALVDLKLALESRKSVERFLAENEYRFSQNHLSVDLLSSVRNLNCDGLLQINVNNTQIDFGLEFENVRQNDSVYKLKIKKTYASPIVATVFVASSPAIIKSLRKIEQQHLEEINVSPKIFYALLQDVLSGQEEMIFVNLINQKLAIS